MSDDSRYRDETGYRCTECGEPLEVTDKAPESYAPDWQVKPCQACLDKLEEATKDELNEDWTKDYDKLKGEHEIDKDVWRRDALQYANEISALKTQAYEAEAEVARLSEELQTTKLLLKDAQQAHLFAKFRADRLSGED